MTKEQMRARAAWAQCQDPGVRSKEYVSLVKSMPASIMMDGLGQTVAFYLSKNKGHHKLLLRHVAQWVLGDGRQLDTQRKPKDLIDEITSRSSDRYRELTAETMAYLTWLKRFADAVDALDAEPNA